MQKASEIDIDKSIVQSNDLYWSMTAYFKNELKQLVDILNLAKSISEESVIEISYNGLSFFKQVKRKMSYHLVLPRDSFLKYAFDEEFNENSIVMKNFKIKNLALCAAHFKGCFHIDIDNRAKKEITLYETDSDNYGWNKTPYRRQQYQFGFSDLMESNIVEEHEFKEIIYSLENKLSKSDVVIDFTDNMIYLYESMKKNGKPRDEDSKFIHFKINKDKEFIFFFTGSIEDFSEEVNTRIEPYSNFVQTDETIVTYDYYFVWKVFAIFKKTYIKDIKSVKFYFGIEKPLVIMLATDFYEFRFVVAPYINPDDSDDDESDEDDDESDYD